MMTGLFVKIKKGFHVSIIGGDLNNKATINGVPQMHIVGGKNAVVALMLARYLNVVLVRYQNMVLARYLIVVFLSSDRQQQCG